MSIRNIVSRLLIMIFCFFGSSTTVESQKAKNRLIIWDVTASMVGYTDHGNDPSKNIAKDVKIGISKIIDGISDDGGTFRILPFTSNILDFTRIFNNNFNGKKDAKQYVESYLINNTPNGNTNICEAWDKAMAFIDPSKENIIYLFTDGGQNTSYGNLSSTECLSFIIDKYCSLTKGSDAFTFFVSLNVANKTFSNSLDTICSNLKYLELNDVKNNGIHLPVSLNLKFNPLVINLEDNPHTAIERFKCIGGELPNTNDLKFTAEFILPAIPDIDIKYLIGKTQGDNVDIEFELDDVDGLGIKRLKDSTAISPMNAIIRLQSNNTSIYDFGEKEIKVQIVNRHPQQLHVSLDKDLNFGTLHPKEKIQKELMLDFNNEAISDTSAFIELAFLTEKDDRPTGIDFLVNGKSVESNRIKFYARDFRDTKKAKIGVYFKEGSKEQSFKGKLELINVSPQLRENTYLTGGDTLTINHILKEWNAKYVVPTPGYVRILLILLFLLLISLFVWFLALKEKTYPKFQGGDIYLQFMGEKEGKQLSLKGKTGILINNLSNRKQGFFSKLFTGEKVILKYDADTNFEVQIRPTRKKNKTWAKIHNISHADIKVSNGSLKDLVYDGGLLYNEDKFRINQKLELTYLNYNHLREE